MSDMEPLSLSLITLLWAAGLLAGFVDSIAGGGGIISLPVLLSTGMPPHLALGTNKLQGTFGSLTSSFNYWRKGLVDFNVIPVGIVFTAMGALAGTISVQLMPAGYLKHIIIVLLALVFIYTVLTPELGEKEKPPIIPELAFYGCAGLTLGFYDGFFGPGTGSFWCISIVLLMGAGLKKATAHTKVLNFTSNIVALSAFFIGGNIMLPAGIAMGIGQSMGAYTGSRLVIKKGTGFIRFFLMAVVAATLSKLIYSTYF